MTHCKICGHEMETFPVYDITTGEYVGDEEECGWAWMAEHDSME
jgi:hypothetical protein